MGYEIVGAVLDDYGNPISAEDLEAMILARHGVGSLTPAAYLRSTGQQRGGNFLPSSRFQAQRLSPGSMAAAIAPAARVVPTAPGPVDEVPLPITSSGTVAAGAQVSIAVTSQIIFRPQRLIVPDSIATFFTIDSVNVGNVPLFAGVGSLPAEVFTPDSLGANIRKVTATPGLQITLQVTNIDGVPHTFRAALFGPGSQPEGCRG